jgi:hypothetical protein
MIVRYVLIDYENVQPRSLEPLVAGPDRILVFTGIRQTKIPTDFADSMQKFGSNAEYVRLATGGSNQLDFHIAFYLGQLSAKHPDAEYLVVSRDKGYDPLIKHLNAQHVACRRCAALEDVRPTRTSASTTKKSEKILVSELADRVVKNFAKRTGRPASTKTLENTVKKLIGEENARQLSNVLGELKRRDFYEARGQKVAYPGAK